MFNVIIPAAGSGSRVGLDYNKLLYTVGDMTILEKTVASFLNNDLIKDIYIPTSEIDFDIITSIFKKIPQIKVVNGGPSRQESVGNALEYCNQQYTIVHDGARCFFTSDDLTNLLITITESSLEAYVLALPVTDSIRTGEDGYITGVLDRSKLFIMQTPQVVATKTLKDVHLWARDNKIMQTDEVGLLHLCDVKVKMVESNYHNIKITNFGDLEGVK